MAEEKKVSIKIELQGQIDKTFEKLRKEVEALNKEINELQKRRELLDRVFGQSKWDDSLFGLKGLSKLADEYDKISRKIKEEHESLKKKISSSPEEKIQTDKEKILEDVEKFSKRILREAGKQSEELNKRRLEYARAVGDITIPLSQYFQKEPASLRILSQTVEDAEEYLSILKELTEKAQKVTSGEISPKEYKGLVAQKQQPLSRLESAFREFQALKVAAPHPEEVEGKADSSIIELLKRVKGFKGDIPYILHYSGLLKSTEDLSRLDIDAFSREINNALQQITELRNYISQGIKKVSSGEVSAPQPTQPSKPRITKEQVLEEVLSIYKDLEKEIENAEKRMEDINKYKAALAESYKRFKGINERDRKMMIDFLTEGEGFKIEKFDLSELKKFIEWSKESVLKKVMETPESELEKKAEEIKKSAQKDYFKKLEFLTKIKSNIETIEGDILVNGIGPKYVRAEGFFSEGEAFTATLKRITDIIQNGLPTIEKVMSLLEAYSNKKITYEQFKEEYLKLTKGESIAEYVGLLRRVPYVREEELPEGPFKEAYKYILSLDKEKLYGAALLKEVPSPETLQELTPQILGESLEYVKQVIQKLNEIYTLISKKEESVQPQTQEPPKQEPTREVTHTPSKEEAPTPPPEKEKPATEKIQIPARATQIDILPIDESKAVTLSGSPEKTLTAEQVDFASALIPSVEKSINAVNKVLSQFIPYFQSVLGVLQQKLPLDEFKKIEAEVKGALPIGVGEKLEKISQVYEEYALQLENVSPEFADVLKKIIVFLQGGRIVDKLHDVKDLSSAESLKTIEELSNYVLQFLEVVNQAKSQIEVLKQQLPEMKAKLEQEFVVEEAKEEQPQQIDVTQKEDKSKTEDYKEQVERAVDKIVEESEKDKSNLVEEITHEIADEVSKAFEDIRTADLPKEALQKIYDSIVASLPPEEVQKINESISLLQEKLKGERNVREGRALYERYDLLKKLKELIDRVNESDLGSEEIKNSLLQLLRQAYVFVYNSKKKTLWRHIEEEVYKPIKGYFAFRESSIPGELFPQEIIQKVLALSKGGAIENIVDDLIKRIENTQGVKSEVDESVIQEDLIAAKEKYNAILENLYKQAQEKTLTPLQMVQNFIEQTGSLTTLFTKDFIKNFYAGIKKKIDAESVKILEEKLIDENLANIEKQIPQPTSIQGIIVKKLYATFEEFWSKVKSAKRWQELENYINAMVGYIYGTPDYRNVLEALIEQKALSHKISEIWISQREELVPKLGLPQILKEYSYNTLREALRSIEDILEGVEDDREDYEVRAIAQLVEEFYKKSQPEKYKRIKGSDPQKLYKLYLSDSLLKEAIEPKVEERTQALMEEAVVLQLQNELQKTKNKFKGIFSGEDLTYSFIERRLKQLRELNRTLTQIARETWGAEEYEKYIAAITEEEMEEIQKRATYEVKRGRKGVSKPFSISESLFKAVYENLRTMQDIFTKILWKEIETFGEYESKFTDIMAQLMDIGDLEESENINIGMQIEQRGANVLAEVMGRFANDPHRAKFFRNLAKAARDASERLEALNELFKTLSQKDIKELFGSVLQGEELEDFIQKVQNKAAFIIQSEKNGEITLTKSEHLTKLYNNLEKLPQLAQEIVSQAYAGYLGKAILQNSYALAKYFKERFEDYKAGKISFQTGQKAIAEEFGRLNNFIKKNFGDIFFYLLRGAYADYLGLILHHTRLVETPRAEFKFEPNRTGVPGVTEIKYDEPPQNVYDKNLLEKNKDLIQKAISLKLIPQKEYSSIRELEKAAYEYAPAANIWSLVKLRERVIARREWSPEQVIREIGEAIKIASSKPAPEHLKERYYRELISYVNSVAREYETLVALQDEEKQGKKKAEYKQEVIETTLQDLLENLELLKKVESGSYSILDVKGPSPFELRLEKLPHARKLIKEKNAIILRLLKIYGEQPKQWIDKSERVTEEAAPQIPEIKIPPEAIPEEIRGAFTQEEIIQITSEILKSMAVPPKTPEDYNEVVRIIIEKLKARALEKRQTSTQATGEIPQTTSQPQETVQEAVQETAEISQEIKEEQQNIKETVEEVGQIASELKEALEKAKEGIKEKAKEAPSSGAAQPPGEPPDKGKPPAASEPPEEPEEPEKSKKQKKKRGRKKKEEVEQLSLPTDEDIAEEIKEEAKEEIKQEAKEELKEEIKEEIKEEVKKKTKKKSGKKKVEAQKQPEELQPEPVKEEVPKLEEVKPTEEKKVGELKKEEVVQKEAEVISEEQKLIDEAEEAIQKLSEAIEKEGFGEGQGGIPPKPNPFEKFSDAQLIQQRTEREALKKEAQEWVRKLEGSSLDKVLILGKLLEEISSVPIDSIDPNNLKDYLTKLYRILFLFEEVGPELSTNARFYFKGLGGSKAYKEVNQRFLEVASLSELSELYQAAEAFDEVKSVIYETNAVLNALNTTFSVVAKNIEGTISPAAQKLTNSLRILGRVSRGLTSLSVITGGASYFVTRGLRELSQYALQAKWYADRMGLSIRTIQGLIQTLPYYNTDIQQFATSISVLSRKLLDALAGSGVAVRAINALGISILDANGHMRDTGDILVDIIDKFQQMSNPLERAAISTKIFGRENTKLMSFLISSWEEIGATIAKAELFGAVLKEEDFQKMMVLRRTLLDLGLIFKGIKNQILISIADIIGPFVNIFGKIVLRIRDLTGSLGEAGKYAIMFVAIFTMSLTVLSIAGLLIAKVSYALNALSQALISFNIKLTVTQILIRGLAGAGIIVLTMFLLQKFGVLQNSLDGIIDKTINLGDNVKKIFKDIAKDARNSGEEFIDAYLEGMQSAKYRLLGFARQLAQELFVYFGGGHSPAKIGPLSNLEYWGAEFVKAYQEGIDSERQNLVRGTKNTLVELLDNIIAPVILKTQENAENYMSWLRRRVTQLGYDIGASLAGGLWGKQTNILTLVKEFVLDVIKQGVSLVTTTIKDLSNNIKTKINELIDKGVKDIIEQSGLNQEGFFRGLARGFIEANVNEWKQIINNSIDTATNLLLSGVNYLSHGIISIVNNFLPTSEEVRRQLGDWLAQQVQAIQQINFLRSIFAAHAEGTIASKPHIALVAEEGPEAIIPLSPGRRARAIDLWIRTGRLLGIPLFAEGGFTGNVTSLEDWAANLASVLTTTFREFTSGIIQAIARWEDTSKNLSKTINISREFGVSEARKQTQKLEALVVKATKIEGALNTMLRYLYTVASQSQEISKASKAPVTIKESLKTIPVSEVMLKKEAEKFVTEAPKYLKKDDLVGINWSAILEFDYVTQNQGLAKQIEKTRSLKIEYLQRKEAREEFEELKGYLRKKEPLNEYEKGRLVILLNKLYSYLIEAAKTDKNLEASLKENKYNFDLLKGPYVAEKILGEKGASKKPTTEAAESWLNTAINKAKELENAALLDYRKLATQTKNELEKEIAFVNSKLKATKTPSGNVFTPKIDSQTKIEKRFAGDLTSIVSTLQGSKTAQYWNKVLNIAKFFEKEVKYENIDTAINDLSNNFSEIIKVGEVLAQEFTNIENKYKQGQITYAEYLKEIENLTAKIETFNNKVKQHIENYDKDINTLTDWRLKLQSFITAAREGKITSMTAISDEGILNFLKATGKFTENKEGETFVNLLIEILQDELNNTEKMINILTTAKEGIESQNDTLLDIKQNGIKISAEPFIKAQQVTYDILGRFIQGSFEEGFSVLHETIKEALLKGVLDNFAKQSGFNEMATALSDLIKKLYTPDQLNLKDLTTFLTKFMWGFVSLDERFRRSVGRLFSTGLTIFNNLMKGADEWAKTFKENEPFLNILRAPYVLIRGIGDRLVSAIGSIFPDTWKYKMQNVAIAADPFRWVGAIADIMQMPTEQLRKFFPEFIKNFFNINIGVETFKGIFKDTGLSKETQETLVAMKDVVNSLGLLIRNNLAKVLGVKPEEVKSLGDVFNKFLEKNPVLQKAWQTIQPIGGALKDVIGSIFGGPVGALLANLGLDALFAVLQDFFGIFEDIYNGFLKDFVGMLKTVLKPIIMPLMAHFATILKGILQIIKPFVPLLAIFAEIIGIIIRAFTVVATVIFSIFKPIIYVFGKIVAGILWAIGKALSFLSLLIGDIGYKMMAAADEINKALDEMMQESPEVKQEDVEKQQKKDQPISIANLTGTALEEFKKLLQPLTALERLDSYFQEMIAYLKDIASALGSVPKMASGGIVTAPTLAWVGEKGPEAIIPLNSGGTYTSSIVINNLNVYVEQIADAEDIEALTQAVLKRAGVEVRKLNYRRGGL